MNVEFWFDPMCPYAYQTSVWIRRVREQVPMQITWRFFSLEEINRQEGKKPMAMLVRGFDAYNHWDHEPVTEVEYDPALLERLHDHLDAHEPAAQHRVAELQEHARNGYIPCQPLCTFIRFNYSTFRRCFFGKNIRNAFVSSC